MIGGTHLYKQVMLFVDSHIGELWEESSVDITLVSSMILFI